MPPAPEVTTGPRLDAEGLRLTLTPSDAQRRAIQAPLGPVLVVAGPGAGKTYCLIARIGHLIAHEGLSPGRICAVTFTNKAADEIAARLRREIGPAAEEIRRGTLHSLCFSLLRDYAAAAGLRRGIGIADEDYQRRVLRRLRVRPERQKPLLQLFGRHRLQHVPLTAGDLELFRAYSDDPVREKSGRLRRSDRPNGRPAARACRRAGRRPGPLGLRAGRRVPGPEPGAVRGRHPPHVRARPLLRGG